MSSEPQHAPLPPSSADRWVQCGRSPSLEALFPDDGGEASREGTAAHWVFAEMMAGRVHPVGTLDPDGTAIDQDMIDNAATLATEVHPDACVEERVHMTAIHPTDNWGTCDAFYVDRPARAIYIWDYKYGHGFVDAVNNWQMINYAQGVIEREGLAPGALDVVMTIFQPRYYGREGPMRSHRMTGAEHAAAVQKLHLAAKLASPNANAVTGPACKYCKGRVACQASQRASGHMMDVSMQTSADLPTGADAGRELATLNYVMAHLRSRITGLEEYVKQRINAGEATGYVLEQGYGREKWTVGADEVFALGDLMGLEFRKPSEAITPAQAVKLGLDPDVKSAYSTKPKGEVKLIPVTKSAALAAFDKE